MPRAAWAASIGCRAVPEFLILCSSNDRSGLTGFKGLVKEDEVERIGTPVHVPLFGFKRSEAPDAEIDTFLRLTLTPQQVPGLTNYSMALGHYIFTNYFGLYNESGVTGTAGKLSLSDRASSGFRPSFFLNSTALLYGSIQQWGFHLGYRNDDLAATCWREDAKFPLQSIITGNQLADSKLTLLSSRAGQRQQRERHELLVGRRRRAMDRSEGGAVPRRHDPLPGRHRRLRGHRGALADTGRQLLRAGIAAGHRAVRHADVHAHALSADEQHAGQRL